jgi:hypothetical protein
MTLVRYLGVPPELFLEFQEVLDGLQREVQITSLDGGHPVGDAVVDGIVVQREKLVDVRVKLYRQAAEAREAGLELVDLEAEYPGDSVEQVLAVGAALRGALVAASEGRLLSLPVSEEMHHFQAWIFDQVEVQLRGGTPTPYRRAIVSEEG